MEPSPQLRWNHHRVELYAQASSTETSLLNHTDMVQEGLLRYAEGRGAAAADAAGDLGLLLSCFLAGARMA